MSDTEVILAAELEASKRRAEELAALLDQERKVMHYLSSRKQFVLKVCPCIQRALEAEQRLREREKLLAEKDRPKVQTGSRAYVWSSSTKFLPEIGFPGRPADCPSTSSKTC
jgi:hypothetical protein